MYRVAAEFLDDLARSHGAFDARHLDVVSEIAECPAGLVWGPRDEGISGYFFARLPYHLGEAGRAHALHRLLGSYAWLDGKLRACGVAELIDDFEHIANLDTQERGLALLRDALRLSSHVLARDVTQLPGQLVGRLGGFRADLAVVRSLLDSASTEPTESWICPVVANLTPPGGPLLRTFEGHSYSVYAVALSKDGKRALSGSLDRTAKLWDTDTGQMLRTFEGHADSVRAVALSKDGKRALSGSDDNTLKLWDTETARIIATYSADTAIYSCVLSMSPMPVLVAGDQSGRVHILRLRYPHAKPAIIRRGRIDMDAIHSRLMDAPRPPLDTTAAIQRVMADLRRIIDTLATELADKPPGATAPSALSQASNRAILALDQRGTLDSALLRRAADRLAGEPTTSPELAVILHAIKSVL